MLQLHPYPRKCPNSINTPSDKSGYLARKKDSRCTSAQQCVLMEEIHSNLIKAKISCKQNVVTESGVDSMDSFSYTYW